MNHIFHPDEKGLAVEKIMDENVPGWRDRAAKFETFDGFVSWIDDCVRGIITHHPTRKDH